MKPNGPRAAARPFTRVPGGVPQGFPPARGCEAACGGPCGHFHRCRLELPFLRLGIENRHRQDLTTGASPGGHPWCSEQLGHSLSSPYSFFKYHPSFPLCSSPSCCRRQEDPKSLVERQLLMPAQGTNLEEVVRLRGEVMAKHTSLVTC